MLSSVRRALTLAAAVPVTAAAMLAGAPAASANHELPFTCDPAQSLQLFDGEVLGQRYYLWVQQVSADETRICAGEYPADFVVRIKSGISFDPGGPIVDEGVGSCAVEVLDITAPVDIEVSYDVTATPTLCLGLNGETMTLGLTVLSLGELPNVGVWRSANPAFPEVFCVDWYVAYQLGTNEYGYLNCRTSARRLV